MTTPTSNSQMHNDIMADESNKIKLKQCIFDGPYVMTEVIIPAKPAIATQEAVHEHTVPETYRNTTLEKHAYIDAEAEAIHMILSGIGDEIYSTIDACTTAKEMWISIERLQQAKNENPLALFAATQQYPDKHYQAPKPHKTYAPSSKHTPSTRSHALTRIKGKEIAKPIIPPSESASKEEEGSEPKHAQRDKDMQKNLALIAK
ncbi:hypothetical protein Tco_1301677 [Tanacetum coccineum]